MRRHPILALLAAWALLATAACGDDDARSPKPFFRDLPAHVHISHRGGAGLFPENTLYAFQHATSEYQTDMLEMDLVISSDDNIMVSHDKTVDRTTDATGNINDMTLAELKALDAAYRFDPDGDSSYPLRGQGIQMATLEEIFQALPNQHYLLEIKDTENEYEQELHDLIVQYDMRDRVIFGSFIDSALDRMLAIDPDIATYYPTAAATCFVTAANDGDDPMVECDKHYDALSLPEGGIFPELISFAHANGIAVWAWTIDDPGFMQSLFDMGVDGIITNRPDLLRQVIDGL